MVSPETMRNAGPLARDLAAALAVLALVFLNFAHAPASDSVGYDGELRPYLLAQATPDCLDTGDRSHAPCEACQIGGTALPAAPAVAGGFLPFAQVADWAATPCAHPTMGRNPAAPARGPPEA
jgi:hypothetical protein